MAKMSSRRFGSGSGKMSSKPMSKSTSNNSMTQRTPGGKMIGAGCPTFSNTQKSTAPKKID